MADIQIIHSPSGDELVVLPRAEYEALVAAAADIDEDAADIAMYDARKAELANDPNSILPPEVSAMLLRGHSRLQALRKWRGIAQIKLAADAGIAQGYLSDLEHGRKSGSAETIGALAQALDVPVEWVA
ncbi:helix-turn-helix transcriptional regulator [Mesorhizobium sp. LHD-90]|uniref:helix-turn-helix domain-containing protein n=1 Tax=Mesorhizobium sp. LHD-90 TaxID=3071414 RepID=UPI0027E02F74|nr:helix-turn-helix transcriptional regulator [Mesorhizobium sp. LHD-90]MDQ6433373.1 helix-turn-helix transcriptional regulator [Mesorhizobium sp. LHD-90]